MVTWPWLSWSWYCSRTRFWLSGWCCSRTRFWLWAGVAVELGSGCRAVELGSGCRAGVAVELGSGCRAGVAVELGSGCRAGVAVESVSGWGTGVAVELGSGWGAGSCSAGIGLFLSNSSGRSRSVTVAGEKSVSSNKSRL